MRACFVRLALQGLYDVRFFMLNTPERAKKKVQARGRWDRYNFIFELMKKNACEMRFGFLSPSSLSSTVSVTGASERFVSDGTPERRCGYTLEASPL